MLKRISVSRGLTVNLGNYESARVDVSVEADVKSEDLTYAAAQLDNWLKAALASRAEEIESGISQRLPFLRPVS